jgi:hypothetical protein
VGDGDGVLIGMGAGAGKCPARSRLMPDDAYVSIVVVQEITQACDVGRSGGARTPNVS